jgi:BNR repeat-like domain
VTSLVPVRDPEHRIVHRDSFSYCAHPHLVALPDGSWCMVFNRAPRRPIVLHPPEEPEFRNLLVRSADRGATWSAPVVAPGYDWHGVECAGLTALADGRVLLNQWRFRWYPLPTARRLAGAEDLTFPADLAAGLIASPEHEADAAKRAEAEALMPWARGNDGAYVHLSDDGGATFVRTVRIDTGPFSGGYGMRGAIELPGGRLMLPLSDVPHYERVFVVHSGDRGESWGAPITAASEPGRAFEEPCALLLPSGRILMLLRENRSRHLYQVVSDDGGQSWSRPAPTLIDGYPPHLLRLADGRILCTYGYRRPDYGIRAVLSADGGRSWDVGRTLRIKGGLPSRDLGYPCTLPSSEGRLVTVYYGQGTDGITSIQSTSFGL